MAADQTYYLTMIDLQNHDLLPLNTFGIKAYCRRFIEFSTVDELRTLVSVLTEADKPLLILGGGSNLLLTKDFDGTVLHSAIRGTEIISNEEKILLRVGSGEVWDDIVSMAVAHGWYGMENLSLIPGEVGASAVQNIGAYGVEVKDLITKIEAVDLDSGEIVTFTNSDCDYSYRYSRFKGEWRDRYMITYVTYRLSTTFTPNIEYGNIKSELARLGISNPTATDLRNVIIDIRNNKLPDPKVEGNGGSFFMNPVVDNCVFERISSQYPAMPHYKVDEQHVKIPAAWLIEQCGWKGRTVGRAGVHSRQALVLVNKGGATGKEILALCEKIREDVVKKFGVEINPEVNIK